MALVSVRAARQQQRRSTTTTTPGSRGGRQGIWAEEIVGRYRKITVHQLAMTWWAYQVKHITLRQFRCVMAAHEMAERRVYTDPVEGPERPLFTLDELKALVGGRGSKTADAALAADVRHLARIGLVTISDHTITFAVSIDQLAIENVAGFWELFNQLEHPRRSVPVPRRMVRALAGGFSGGVTAVVIATLIRSLFWRKERGAYRVDGRTKREWIAQVFGISLRTVTDARARLIELGWLVPLETSQWLLNRYGNHDAIDPAWAMPKEDAPCTGSSGGAEIASGELASPRRWNQGESASPDQTGRSSSLQEEDSKTRRLGQPCPGPSGASLRESDLDRRKGSRRRAHRSSGGAKSRSGRAGRHDRSAPNIRNVKPHDLAETDRLLELWRQAIDLGLSDASEASRLNFFALAERARARGKRAGALLFWLLSRKKTMFITQIDEDRAAQRLREHLNGPAGPRQSADEEQGGGRGEIDRPAPVEFTDDDNFVLACIRVGKDLRVDPFRIAREAKGWTKDKWNDTRLQYELKSQSRWNP